MIHSYTYRNPRRAICVAVEFAVDGGTLIGSTDNISEEGLSANFGEPVLPKTAGNLRFRLGRCFMDIGAEVTHTEGFQTGMAFRFSSTQERLLLKAILQALTALPSATERDE